ncbi:hypothetical protein C0992_004050 [Termitomyces sp. T32_za158]|nr:hypothetical protein C0992_004050 [Termitomyces sp. T32_za158]
MPKGVFTSQQVCNKVLIKQIEDKDLKKTEIAAAAKEKSKVVQVNDNDKSPLSELLKSVQNFKLLAIEESSINTKDDIKQGPQPLPLYLLLMSDCY